MLLLRASKHDLQLKIELMFAKYYSSELQLRIGIPKNTFETVLLRTSQQAQYVLV